MLHSFCRQICRVAPGHYLAYCLSRSERNTQHAGILRPSASNKPTPAADQQSVAVRRAGLQSRPAGVMVATSEFIDSIPHLSVGKKATLETHVQSQEFGVSLDADCDEIFQKVLQQNPPATFNILELARLEGALQQLSQAKAKGQIFIVSLLVPSSKEKKAQEEEVQICFDRPPSYLALLDSIERGPTALKLDQVNFHIKAGKESKSVLFSRTMRLVGDRGAIKLAKAKPLSSFTNEEGMRLLMGPNYQQAETKPFALADLTTSARLDDAVIHVTHLVTVKDSLSHLGVDLALRCLRSEPQLHLKEYANRELISPLLYVASVLAGELEVAAEFSTKDRDAAGSVDFVVLLKSFVISLLEGKVHDTLKEHEGQL
ncbi:hypothetical protein WJX77_002769 [Trebouxia sp. C0004]